MEPVLQPHHRYAFVNQPSGVTLDFELRSETQMPPSCSTQILIENMVIRPGESVLDLGAGTGIVGIAASKLGAGSVTLLDIDADAETIMQHNVARNGMDASAFEYVIGDLYAPLGRRRFDHIVANLPSIPSPGNELPLAYRSGADGRLLHDAVQFLARYYLKANGRLTLVHGSLCNLPLSLDNLGRLGFDCTLTAAFEAPFRDFYPLDHIRKLADDGHAQFFVRDGVHYENRHVVTAMRKEEHHSPVMHLLDARHIAFRMLPHKRIAKTVTLAAAERQVLVNEMVKCILLKDRQGKFALACLTGEADLDVQRVRHYLRDYSRLSFASPDEIRSVTGYELGSVAPVAPHMDVPLVVDEAVTLHQRVNISSGDPRLGLELTRGDLMEILGSRATVGVIRKTISGGPP